MTDGSVTHWIGQVKEGTGSVAEQRLWDHYFARLAALARQTLQDMPPHLRDDEDLALSALNSFFTRARQDGFPLLYDRTDLWHLLAKITVRKSIQRRRNLQAQKRGQGNSDFAEEIHNIVARQPTPDMLASLNEECQRLLNSLQPQLRLVCRMKLEGYTNQEIATKLSKVERTVERKLEQIRYAWQREIDRQ